VVAFGVLPVVAFALAEPLGGTYKASDVTGWIASGHRVAVLVSLYLVFVAIAGLVCLLTRLRALLEGSGRESSIFWAFGIGAATACFVGYALVCGLPLARWYGGDAITVAPATAYTLAELGWIVWYGAGALLLGAALVAFASAPVAAPAWVRWATLAAGIASLAGPAWFPFFLVFLWSLVLGVWLLVADPQPARVAHARA
jgi:hypothetical protein